MVEKYHLHAFRHKMTSRAVCLHSKCKIKTGHVIDSIYGTTKKWVQNLQQFCYVNTHGFSIHQFKTMKKWLLAINFIVHKPDCWIIRFSDLSKAENKETPPSIKYSQMLLIKHRISVALSDRDALFCCSQKVSTGNLRNKTNKNICKYKVDVFTSNRNENTNVLPF